MTAPIETELKLDLDKDAGSAIRNYLIASFGRHAEKHRLVSTYFDTLDKHLWHAGVTLRVRQDGERYIQTIKVENSEAAGLFSRPEWERGISGVSPNLDEPTEKLLTKLTGGPVPAKALAAQFTTDIERTLWHAECDGAVLEVSSDEGAISSDGRILPVHELEIELKSGPKAALFQLAARIGAAVPLRIAVQSKAERGHVLGGRGDGEARKAEPIPLTGDMTVAKGFQAIGRACLRHYRLNEALFLEAPHPELLHQCRVALRRLRSALVLFKTLLDDPESITLSHRLRESTLSFGDGRNIDVLIGRLNNAPLAAKKLALQREQIYAELLVELRSLEFRALMLDLTAWINTGAWLSEADTEDERTGPIDRYAVHMLRRCRRRLKRCGKHLSRLDAAHQHAVRISAKKLRYAAEFFCNLFPGRGR